MKLKIKKIRESAKLPKFKTEGSVGMDFYVSLEGLDKKESERIVDGTIIIMPGETKILPLGVAIQLEPGYEMAIRPRSSILSKGVSIYAIDDVNKGTIDSDYRGECCVIVSNNSKNIFIVEDGQRICQGVISRVETPVNGLEIEEVEELDNTERAEQGFGHTGK